MIGSDYPLLDIFWTTLWIFCFIIFIFLVFQVFIDIFRSQDLGGGAKALWVIFVIFLPFLGILIYLIARGSKMHERQVQQAVAQQKAMDDYIRKVASEKPADSSGS
jgi:hypothetical protein